MLNKRAFELQDSQARRGRDPCPEGKADVVAESDEALKESVAETSDEFMDKFFSGETFTYPR